MEGRHQPRSLAALKNRVFKFFPSALTLTLLTSTITFTNAAAAAPPMSTSSVFAFAAIAKNVTEITTKSEILTANVTLAERRQHVAWFAESHTDWGFRYRLGNASLDNGFDCSGFVSYVLGYFDFKTKRSSTEQYNEGTQLPVEQAKSGDLVFFGGKNSVSHVAIVISNDDKGLVVIHSTCSRGIVRENITESKYWRPKLKSMAVNIIGD